MHVRIAAAQDLDDVAQGGPVERCHDPDLPRERGQGPLPGWVEQPLLLQASLQLLERELQTLTIAARVLEVSFQRDDPFVGGVQTSLQRLQILACAIQFGAVLDEHFLRRRDSLAGGGGDQAVVLAPLLLAVLVELKTRRAQRSGERQAKHVDQDARCCRRRRFRGAEETRKWLDQELAALKQIDMQREP